MGKRAKYKEGDEVEFTFVGSKHIGIIELREHLINSIRYKIRAKNGMLYPVDQDKVGKIK